MFAFLETLFVFGSVGFWLLSATASLMLLGFTHFEKFGWAVFTVIIFSLLIGFGGNGSTFTSLITNPVALILTAVGYVAAGLVWAFVKWEFLVRERKEEFLRLKRRIESGGKNFREVWKNDYIDNRQEVSLPDPGRHKGTITGWMALWPFSVFNTVCFDFVFRFFKHLFTLTAGLFRSRALAIYGTEWSETIKPFEKSPTESRDRDAA